MIADQDTANDVEQAHFENCAVAEESEAKDPDTSVTVSIPGVSAVHKSTLFSILNTNQTSVSKDRPTRVKSKLTANQKSKDMLENLRCLKTWHLGLV